MKLNDPFEWAAPANSDQSQRRAFRNTKKQMSEKSAILCFSKTWRNPVMWSHYANGHKGVCLGFDVPRSEVTEVRYTSKRTTIDWNRLNADSGYGQEIMMKTLATKFSHWRYEKEVRMFTPLDGKPDEKGNYFFEFGDNLVLKEIIVGAESKISRNKLAQAVGSLASQIKICKARLSFKEFKVVNQMKKTLWK